MGLDRNSVDGRDIAPKSVDTDDATYNDSVTYPDGTVVTTSPGGSLASGEVGHIQLVEFVGQATPTTTSTTYVEVARDDNGGVIESAIPSSLTPVIRFVAHLRNQTSSETTFVRPHVYDYSSEISVTEAEVSVTSTSFTLADSGWVDISSFSGVASVDAPEMKVSGGTGEFEEFRSFLMIGGKK